MQMTTPPRSSGERRVEIPAGLEKFRLSMRCPDCLRAFGEPIEGALRCDSCGRRFPWDFVGEGVAMSLLPTVLSPLKTKIQSFWGDLCRQWYTSNDSKRSATELEKELDLLTDMFRRRTHLAVTEMGEGSLAGKKILEIGSGGGAHSALFRRRGADIVALDLTPERVFSTATKQGLLQVRHPGAGLALQGDSESLPFEDETFDIVYSNGVLHHTEDTRQAIQEAHRVLKKGGKIVLMLYSRNSALYWLKLWPAALLRGWIFHVPERYWMGWLTEGRPKFQSEPNPITSVYSAREIRSLLRDFNAVQLRKTGFTFGHFPFPWSMGVRDRLFKWFGGMAHPAGRIVYGHPYVMETRLEKWLGQWVGFDWNIEGLK